MTQSNATAAATETRESPRALVASDLPKPGDGRWWRITFNVKSNKTPMKVELMEMHVPGRRAMSTVIGWENTIASQKSIVETCDLVLARCGDYELFLGEFELA